MMEIPGILLFIFDLLDRIRPKPLSRRQTEAVEMVVGRIKKELPHIRAQAEGDLPRFSGPAHEKAVLVTSWEMLISAIEPLKSLPEFRRRSRSILKCLQSKDARRLSKMLPDFMAKLEEILIRRGQ